MKSGENSDNASIVRDKDSIKKWGASTLEAGFTILPAVLFERQKALGLSPQELNVLLQLLRHWWQSDSYPFPSRRVIAEQMGCTQQTVQRHLSSLKANGFIEIERRKLPNGGYTSSRYRFDGLVKMLKPLAEEVLVERSQRMEAKQNREKRKNPRVKKGEKRA